MRQRVHNTTMKDKLSVAVAELPSTKRKAAVEKERTARVRRHFSGAKTLPPPQAPIDIEPSPSPDQVQQTLELVASASAANPEPEKPQDLAPPSPPKEEYSAFPFSHQLGPVLSRLKDARNVVVFRLEQTNTRLTAKRKVLDDARADVDNEELTLLTTTEELEKIDTAIAKCNELDGLSLGIAPLLVTPSHAHRLEKTGTRPDANDPRVVRRKDVLKHFEDNPDGNWSAAEIISSLPPIKRSHGKKSVAQILANLTIDGKIVRVTTGVYKLVRPNGGIHD